MEYEVVDNFGNKKWIKEDEAKSYGLLTKTKKGNWIPVVGGVVGGLIGGIAGAGVGSVPGAVVGVSGGTAGGVVLQDLLYGKANRQESDYTGEKTKLGFEKLSNQGRVNQAMDVANGVKDVAIAGGTAYVGAKIPGMGPAGKGILPSLGRIGTKTVVGSALGAGTGFTQGDLQDTSLEDRTSNAKTGAIVGGSLSLLGSTFQEIVRKYKTDEILKRMIKQKGFEKINYPKAGSELANEGAKEAGNFDRTKFLKDWFGEIQKSSDANKLKQISLMEKTLSSETGLDIKGLGSASEDDFAKLIDEISKLDKFKKDIPAFDALLKRRDNASTLAKDLFGKVKQTSSNYMKLSQNTAYNKQLQNILKVKQGDAAIKSYYSMLSLLKKIGAISAVTGIVGGSTGIIGKIARLGNAASGF